MRPATHFRSYIAVPAYIIEYCEELTEDEFATMIIVTYMIRGANKIKRPSIKTNTHGYALKKLRRAGFARLETSRGPPHPLPWGAN